MSVALLYALFAAIATAVNIGTQALVDAALVHDLDLYIALVIGTVAGLVCKYLLDKRWIFGFAARSRAHEARTFVIYATFSVVTTVIFWGTELMFEAIWGTDRMRYLGGALGLALGYASKYFLDKRITFASTERSAVA
ncbi:GtrA family protein [Demequina mangrovi]|uniref:GtrA-like protein n=1 Tax=Demequina mangrovi TaxID=1043493 RepID=A0A1H6YF04_9MICO|nr:GtrA family protein [Demequina mangrovi]SEJ39868.1 GtrA-like protein [Demequina mangrovi]